MAREKIAQLFAGFAALLESAQEPLDGVGHFRRRAAIANGTRDGSNLADAAANAEVIRVDELALGLDFLAFNADVGDPVLSAAIGAARDVQLDLLLEAREAVIELFREPAREALRFGQRELAVFRAGARDGAASKGG